MLSVSKDVLLNYFTSEFKVKKTSDPDEIRINSIYTNNCKFKTYINVAQQKFIDFVSGNQGSVYSLIKDRENFNSVKDVLWFLMKNYSTQENFLEFQEQQEQQKSNSQVIEEFLKVDKPIWFYQKEKIDSIGKEALRYLLNRKIPISEIKKMGFVSNPKSRYYNRLIIPYFENGVLVYFQARSLDPNNKLRYLNPAGLDTKSFVFNYDKIDDEELIICEGPFDALSFTEQTATCMCSGDLSRKQISKIFRKATPKTIIYVPDGDETGRAKMNSNIERILTYAPVQPKILIFDVPDGCKDANEMLVKLGKDFILKSECKNYEKNIWRDFNFG